jgi:hypothetical protein
MNTSERHDFHGLEYSDDPRFTKARRYMGRKALAVQTSHWVYNISVMTGGYLAAVGWSNDNSLTYYTAGATALAAGAAFRSYTRRRESNPDVIEKDARRLSDVLPRVRTEGDSAINVLKRVSTELNRARFRYYGDTGGQLKALLGGYSQAIPEDDYQSACRQLHNNLRYSSLETDASDDTVVASKMTLLTNDLATRYSDLSPGQHVCEEKVNVYAAMVEILDKRLPLDENSGFDSWGTYTASIVHEEALTRYIDATSERIDTYINNPQAA